MTRRVGALCAGYGGLDLAVKAVLGGELAWVADKDPASAKVLAHRFPDAPNLGDITAIDWAQVEPVDILTAGFPCQDLSLAGRRAGLRAGTRSGIWKNVRDAVAVLRPSLVIVENVRGLLSAPADGDVERCPWCLGDGSGEPPLRGIGVVLGDLAELGFDAEWVGLRAADVGACHGRFRVGILAWPAADSHRDAVRLEPVALAGHGGPAVAGLTGVERGFVADASRAGLEVGAVEPDGPQLPAAVGGGGDDASPDPDGQEWQGGDPAAWTGEAERPAPDAGSRSAAGCGRAPAADSDRSTRRLLEPRGLASCPAEGAVLEKGWGTGRGGGAPAGDTPELAWGPYEPGIRLWELTLGRPAPAPTEPGTRGQSRLSPAFVEWMQGLPAGWVTDVPGLTRNDQLRLLGNGVVPQQFTEAIRHLLQRAFGDEAAA